LAGLAAGASRVASTAGQLSGAVPIGELRLGRGGVLLLVAKEQRASCCCCLVCVAVALGGTTPAPVQVAAVPGVGLVAGRQRSVLPRRMESVRLGMCGNGVGRLRCSSPSLVRIGSCRVLMCGFHAVCMLVSAASFGAKRGRV